jgi:hypothetical protein
LIVSCATATDAVSPNTPAVAMDATIFVNFIFSLLGKAKTFLFTSGLRELTWLTWLLMPLIIA